MPTYYLTIVKLRSPGRLAYVLCSQFPRLISRCWLEWLFCGTSGQESTSKVMQVVDRIVPVVVGLRSPFLCWLGAPLVPWDCPTFFLTWPPPLQSQQCCNEFFSCSESLWAPFMPPHWEISLLSRAHVIRSGPPRSLSFIKVNCAIWHSMIIGMLSHCLCRDEGRMFWGMILEILPITCYLLLPLLPPLLASIYSPTRCFARCFLWIILFNIYNISKRWVILSAPFLNKEAGLGQLNFLSKVTSQQVVVPDRNLGLILRISLTASLVCHCIFYLPRVPF